MDFGKFDMRATAEKGDWLVLKDPSVPDGEKLSDGPGKFCRVLVRGVASRSAQSAMRATQRAKLLSSKGKKLDAENATRVMEDVHNEMCENAAHLIIAFEHIERDGVLLTTSAEDVRFFLDLSFPVMAIKTDAEGAVVVNSQGEQQFEMRNNPFAKQITEFASDMGFLSK